MKELAAHRASERRRDRLTILLIIAALAVIVIALFVAFRYLPPGSPRCVSLSFLPQQCTPWRQEDGDQPPGRR